MNKISVLICIFCLGLLSCKNEKGNVEVKPEQAAVQEFEKLPSEILNKMWNEAEMLDYIFHDLPFSMSQDERQSIQANMTYIDKYAQPYIPQGCKPAARQFYQVKGDIVLEADVYFSEGCYFYVFIVDGKPMYANKMAQEGINFFRTMISKALNATKGIG